MIMNTLRIFETLDRDIRLNYNSKAEFGRKVNLTRQKVCNFLKTLERNYKGNDFNKTCSILEKAGYEITITKKEAE